MSNWIETSGRIENLTHDEKVWLERRKEKLQLTFENGNAIFCDIPDGHRQMLQNFLKRFRPNDHIVLSWAYASCWDRGGGVWLVTANDLKIVHTQEWIDEQLALVK